MPWVIVPLPMISDVCAALSMLMDVKLVATKEYTVLPLYVSPQVKTFLAAPPWVTNTFRLPDVPVPVRLLELSA